MPHQGNLLKSQQVRQLLRPNTKKKVKAASKLASSHRNQRIGLFKEEDMQEAINLYRGSHMPGSKEPLSIRKVAELFKEKYISFGSLQKRLSGEVTTIGPVSGGKGKPRILPRDVEG